MKDGTIRDCFFTADNLAFVAPAYLEEEIAAHVGEVAERSRVPLETAKTVLEDVLAVIELLPWGAYSHWIERARELVVRAHAHGDEDYVALCLAMRAPIWTLDRDFHRIPGLKVLSTKDIVRAGERK